MAKSANKGASKAEFRALDSINLSETNKIICGKVKQIRKEAGQNQAEFAETLGVNLPYIKAIEQGRFSPSNEVLKKIAQNYKRSMDWIFGLKD